MKNPLQEGRAIAARHLRVFSLAALAPLFLGCAAAPAETASATAPPAGDIEIATPIKLAPRARVPEKEASFVSAEVTPDLLVLEHDGDLAAFAAGDVLSGTQGGGYLVRVLRARAIDATHVALTTTPAALTDLIVEGEFHVHYDAQALRAPLPGALSLSPGSPLRLFDINHVALPAGCGVDDGGEATLDATATLSPVLDLDVKIGPRGVFDLAPEIKRFELTARGRLDLDAKLSATGAISGACSVDLLELTGGAIRVPLPTLTFWAGPVPIIVESEVVPTAEADLALSLSGGSVRTASRTSLSLAAGVDYEDGTWSPIWDPSSEARGTAAIKAPGPLDVSCEVSAGAEIRAKLYGLIGPSLGVAASTRARVWSSEAACAYEGHIDGGVDGHVRVDAGISVGPLDLTLASLDLIDLEFLHVDGPRLSGALLGPTCGALR